MTTSTVVYSRPIDFPPRRKLLDQRYQVLALYPSWLDTLLKTLKASFPDDPKITEAWAREELFQAPYVHQCFGMVPRYAIGVWPPVVSTATIRHRFGPGVAEIAWVATHPDFRHLGLASALVEFCVQQVRMYMLDMKRTVAAVARSPTARQSAFWIGCGFTFDRQLTEKLHEQGRQDIRDRQGADHGEPTVSEGGALA